MQKTFCDVCTDEVQIKTNKVIKYIGIEIDLDGAACSNDLCAKCFDHIEKELKKLGLNF